MNKHKKHKSQSIIDNKSDLKWLYLIILIHILLAFIYWSYTPLGLPPDEGPHGFYVNYLVEKHSLPVFDPNDRNNYEFHQPPLYYTLGAPFIMLGKLLNLSESVYAVRFLSILLGALSLIFIYHTIQLIFEDKRISLVGTIFAALLPTHVMLSSSVSNDILAELIFSVGLYLIIYQLLKGLSWKLTILTGVVAGAAILTKTTCILIIPVYLVMMLLLLLKKEIPVKTILSHILISMGIGLLAGGWWLVRNNMLYGDPFGLKIFENAFRNTAKPEYFFEQGLSVFQYIMLVAGLTFASFWGVFGHMKIFMPTWVYISLAIIFVPASILSIIVWCREIKNKPVLKNIGIVCITLLLLTLLSFIRFNITFFQAQGRYLYPALIPISMLAALWISKKFSPLFIFAVMVVIQVIAIITIS